MKKILIRYCILLDFFVNNIFNFKPGDIYKCRYALNMYIFVIFISFYVTELKLRFLFIIVEFSFSFFI